MKTINWNELKQFKTKMKRNKTNYNVYSFEFIDIKKWSLFEKNIFIININKWKKIFYSSVGQS